MKKALAITLVLLFTAPLLYAAEVTLTLKAPTAGELDDMGTRFIKHHKSTLNQLIGPWLLVHNNGRPLDDVKIDALTAAQKTKAIQVLVQNFVSTSAGDYTRNIARAAAAAATDGIVNPGTIDDDIQ